MIIAIGFTKYSELISCLVVENNELLMKNHEAPPASANPLLEMNVTNYDNQIN